MTDEELVRQYLNGDEKSLEILVERYLKPVYRFIFRFSNGSHEAEDMVQETFVKIWKNLKKFDQKKIFKAWLFAIAKNTAIDWLRKKKTVRFSDEEMEKIPDHNSLFFFSELSLETALKKIPDQYRATLSLRYNGRFTFKEIAEELGEPLNTVKSRHRRGLLLLKKFLT